MRQFHQSAVVQCGYLIVAWKDVSTTTASSTSGSTTTSKTVYHFIVDGSRASDMAAGVFHYQAPFESSKLQVALISESKVQQCFSLQTRNQGGGSCDGFYIQYDTTASVQFSNTDDYQLSKLDWPIWCAVVGSVAAAVLAVVGVAVFSYRHRHMDSGEGVDDELLSDELDEVASQKKRNKKAGDSNKAAASTHELRQRALSPLQTDDELKIVSQV